MSRLTIPELALIRRFLRTHARPSEIARKMGLAVETVMHVAGSRLLRHRRLFRLRADDLPDDDHPPEYVPGNLRRCPGCGATVYQWPCLACRLLAAQAAGTMLADEPEEPDEVDSGFLPNPLPSTPYSVLSTRYSMPIPTTANF